MSSSYNVDREHERSESCTRRVESMAMLAMEYESLDLGQIAFVSLADTYTSLTIGSGNGHGVCRHVGRVIQERVEHHHGGGFAPT